MGTIDNNGNQTHSLKEMKARTVAYFTTLCPAEPRNSPLPNLNIAIDRRPSVVENAKLRATPNESELWSSLKSMPHGKAPGMDRLTTEIIIHHWGSMKDTITSACQHFFRNKRMLRSLNLATITLITKKPAPERLEDYRPISCPGVAYKAISKILTTRLMSILPGILNPNQTAFIKGRRITDAIRLAQEFT